MRWAPVLQVNARQALTIRRLSRDNERLSATVKRVDQENGRLRMDVELLALCVPPNRRKVALAFVRDHHDIDRLDETPEVEAG